ncbi:MAG: glutamine-hydrolyzing carbamoyl-phosphate synthase small subunit [Bryobacterales bacterium]|nr:glutamine-hydrolyzing carbamoyl-phosphate synthase small subunit [Bryobacterales bacterium]
MNKAILALEDGRIFEGQAFGAQTERVGEVVFNTSITGYQEIFSDPSYAGQIIVLTNPQIGNYGANSTDPQAGRPHIEGLIVRDFSPVASNWRSEQAADAYLADHGIPIGSDMDTRTLVRHLRTRGVMRGALSTVPQSAEALLDKARNAPSMAGLDLATGVSATSSYTWDEGMPRSSPSELLDEVPPAKHHVVAYDLGIKRNILRRLRQNGARVTVVPAATSADEVLALNPDGIFVSNGPGDPEPLEAQALELRKLLGKAPIFGICLGHQVLGRALGGKTFKLKFGHRGGNHPVLNKLTNKVEITAQNHGFAVDPDSLSASEIELTHVNLNDQTLEGFRHRNYPLFCVQYHPEASPGPNDSLYLFADFARLMDENPVSRKLS